MKKMIRTLTASLLSVLMILSALGTVSATEAGTEFTSGDFICTTLGDGTVMISDYIGSAKQLTVPSSVGDHSVSKIGDWAFWGLDFENIVVSEGIKSIGEFAFHLCGSVREITLPSTVTEIGNCAFDSCYALERIITSEKNPCYTSITGVLYSKDKATLVCYPAGKVGKNYTIPSGVTEIGYSAFSFSYDLTFLTIPDTVESIGAFAFEGCEKLLGISVPDSVISIGESAFSDTAWYESRSDGAVYAGKVFYGYKGDLPANASATITDGTLGIADKAFFEDTDLTYVYLPNTLRHIGNFAFYNCSSVTDVYFYGTEAQWNKVDLTVGNDCLSDVTLHLIVPDTTPAATQATATEASPTDPAETSSTSTEAPSTGATAPTAPVTGVTSPSTQRTDPTETSSAATTAPVSTSFSIPSAASTSATTPANTATPSALLHGDANGDGTVNVKDATAIQKHVAGLIVLTGDRLKVADYDRSGTVNVKDATAVQKFVAGLIR